LASSKAVPVRAVRPSREPGPLAQWATRSAKKAAYAGRWYGASLGAALVASGVTGQHELVWMDLGGCVTVVGQKYLENSSWGRRHHKNRRKLQRRYQGHASMFELQRKLSVSAARKHAMKLGLDPEGAEVIIGDTIGHPKQVVAANRADSLLAVAPPQTLKTALISCWVEDAPGSCVAFSSRGDQYRHTALNRGRRGEVLVLNADALKGIPQTFFLDPVAGCEDPRVAMRRASDFMAASPRDPGGKDKWHEARGASLLRLMFHAGALAGLSLREVTAWVSDPRTEDPLKVLEAAGNYEWAAELAALCEQEGDFFSSVVSSAESALAWMKDPWMARIACPADGENVDLWQFLKRGTGTIYVVGEDREFGSLSPYFAFVAAEVFHTARQVAEAQGGKLRRALTMAIDEAATICPVPLHKWSSVAAGYNISLIAAIQALSQLPARWGPHDGDTILTNFTTKIIGGGFTKPEDLEALSLVCGEHEVPVRGRKGEFMRERLYPPERIRLLDNWHALVIHRNTRPVEVVIRPVWTRAWYQRVPDFAETRPGAPPESPVGAYVPSAPALPGPAEAVAEPEPALRME